jgi:hypothetical protein
MTARDVASPAEPYSPQRRTALVLTGIGTAGAYHAGVLRALHEAGVKLDVVAGRGIGVVGALFAAVDGGARLWDDKGFWRAPAVRRFYAWRGTLRLIALALAASLLLVIAPLAAMAVGLVVFPIDFVLKMVGVSAGGGLVSSYLALAERAFAPGGLPTSLPRLVLLVLGVAAVLITVNGLMHRSDRHVRGPFWWRIVRAPFSVDAVNTHCWSVMWDLVRGAAQLKQPPPSELGRRYVEMLSENIGQPGFRELVIAVHDIDAHRDLVFALVDASRRRDLVRRPTTSETQTRQAELQDLAGVAAAHMTDAVAAALAIPLMTEFHTIHFAPDSYWRGEAHRVGDRPAALARLLDELADLDVEQILLVSAAPESPGPHALSRLRLDSRGRLGEYLQSAEAANIRDVVRRREDSGPRIFTIQPSHNPVGPFDFDGGFDDRSDRRQPLSELTNCGYADAYHQFIEPILGGAD